MIDAVIMSSSDSATARSAAPTAPARVPMNTLAIAFGLAGLAGTWTAASGELGLPPIIAEVFWLVATVSWVWLIVAHLVRGARSAETLASQLRHPAQGPIAALVPVVGMLIGDHLLVYSTLIGAILTVTSMAVALAFAGWHLSYWVSGKVDLEAVHGGYYLPTVASGYIGAISLSRLGLPGPAIGAFGVGTLFWFVVFTILVVRLALRPPLPPPLMPTMMIILAPPALGGIAWFAVTGIRADPVAEFLAVALVLMAVMQLALVPRYTKLPFSVGFWSFTFPVTAAGTVTIEWMSIDHPAGWQIIDILVLVAVTALVAAIGIRSIVGVAEDHGRRSGALDRQLSDADAAAEKRDPAL
ncbi:MAG: transporter [Subtercola sp.]|nr:transporter [Subtercola sp.]